jgi:hypothetical protein
MKSNTQITLANGKALFVTETFDELDATINDTIKFIYVTHIELYMVAPLVQKAKQIKMLININHIASIEPI